MRAHRSFLSCTKGGSLILVAVTFMLFMIVMGIVVDIGRIYAVQSKAQNASDSALLGAVATVSTTPLAGEMTRLFEANFPQNYMGSAISNLQVGEVSPDVYEATFNVTVPTVVMQLFGINSSPVHILSQVTRGLESQPNRRLELAMVLDNTGSMAGNKIVALRNASHDLIDILFGDAETLQNLNISVLPYDVAVNIGPGRESWVQAPFVNDYLNTGAPVNGGFVSNRNSDSPRNALNDVSAAIPQTEETRFRTPRPAPFTGCGDTETTALGKMVFALNAKTPLHAMINTMIASGCTRINVGLMWGWFTLAPGWQGLWDPGRPNLPGSPNTLLDKALILMTDGQNTVYNGSNGTSNDNATTTALCNAIKAQGITIYTVGFGQDVNAQLLQNCATLPTYYWHAPTEEELRDAFRAIADDLIFNTIRLSQ